MGPAVRSAWLLREGDVLASAEVVDCGLGLSFQLARRSSLDGVLILRGARMANTAGGKLRVDVAFLDDQLVVLDMVRLDSWRVTLPRRNARHVLHAPSGAFERWGLSHGDKLELRETR